MRLKKKKISHKYDINRPTTMFIIFRGILIDEQIFFSPQIKRSVIISNKYGIYELPHDLPNDLRLRKYQGNLTIS